MRAMLPFFVAVAACSRSNPPAPSALTTTTADAAPAARPDAEPAPATPMLPPPTPRPPDAPPALALEPTRELPLPLDGRELIAAALSPDGTRLAIARSEHVDLYDASTGAPLWLSPVNAASDVAFSPSGAWLWVVSLDGVARLSPLTGQADWTASGGPIDGLFVPTSDEAGLVLGASSAALTLPQGARSIIIDKAVTDAGFELAGALYDQVYPSAGAVVVASPTQHLVLSLTGDHIVFSARPEALGDDAPADSAPGPTPDTRIAVHDGKALLIDARTWRTKSQVELPRGDGDEVISDWRVGASHAQGPRAAILGPSDTVVVDFGAAAVVAHVPRAHTDQGPSPIFGPEGAHLWTFGDVVERWRLEARSTLWVTGHAAPELLVGELVYVLGEAGTTALSLDGGAAWSNVAYRDRSWHAAALGGGRIARVARTRLGEARAITGVQLAHATRGELQGELVLDDLLVADDAAVALDAERVVLATPERIVVWPLPSGAPIMSTVPRADALALSSRALLARRGDELVVVPIGPDGRAAEGRPLGLALGASDPIGVVGTSGLAASKGRLHVIDLAAARVTRTLELDVVDPVRLAADDALGLVAVGSPSGELVVFDLTSGARRYALAQSEADAPFAMTPDGRRVVSGGKRLRVHALAPPPPEVVTGYLAPLLRAGPEIEHRYRAVATVLDVDSGKETRTPSRGEGRCTLSARDVSFALECRGIEVKSDYEVSLPKTFTREGDTVVTDAGWRLPLAPRALTHIELGRGYDDEVVVVRAARVYQEGDTWCHELREGIAHEGLERLCLFAKGGLASYTSSQGSAAMGLDVVVEFKGPDGFPAAAPPE